MREEATVGVESLVVSFLQDMMSSEYATPHDRSSLLVYLVNARRKSLGPLS